MSTVLFVLLSIATPLSAEGPWFEEVAATRGLSFVHESGHDEAYLMPEISAGGAAFFDLEGDGDLDVYLVQAGSLRDGGAPNVLFRNDGACRFIDVSEKSGTADRGYGQGVAAGDYDGDGLTDLYVTNLGPDVLLRNLGSGRFEDVTGASKLGDPGWGSSAAFVDLDRDGDLDLVVSRYLNWSIEHDEGCFDEAGGREYCSPLSYNAPARDLVYRNRGDGTFEDVSGAMGLAEAFGNGFGVVATDLQGDGWPDVFVANDGMPDQLWVNQAGGRFAEEALLAGVAVDLTGKPKAGMGVAAGDYDGDGREDLLVCNLRGETDSLFRNAGDYYEDRTAASGLAAATSAFTRFGVGFADFDNDGELDLYEANGKVAREGRVHSEDPYAEPNSLLRGEAGRFGAVDPAGGTAAPLIATSRAAAFGDCDSDGGVDVLVVNRDAPVHLFRNVHPNRGHWLGVRVVHREGRDALGAVVEAVAGERRWYRVARAAYSYQASNDPTVHFGMGETAKVDRIEVRWPDGPPDRPAECFGPFDAGTQVEVVEGTGKACPAPASEKAP